jgi:CRISPR-associated protein Csd1
MNMLDALLRYAADRPDLSTTSGLGSGRATWMLNFTTDGKFVGLLPGRTFVTAPKPSYKFNDSIKTNFLFTAAKNLAIVTPSSHPGEDEVNAVVPPVADETGDVPAVETPSPLLIAKRAFFVGLLRECAEDSCPEWLPISEALQRADTWEEITAACADVKENESVTLACECVPLVESGDWQSWWLVKHAEIIGKPVDAHGMRCLATGEYTAIADKHPNIANLNASLVGFDKDAFTSYGLKNGYNAAIGEDTAATLAAALGDLVGQRKRHCHRFGGTENPIFIVHWYAAPVDDAHDPVQLLEVGAGVVDDDDDAIPEAVTGGDTTLSVAALIESLRTGAQLSVTEDNDYHLLRFSSPHRLMIRGWDTGALGELSARIAQWFDDLTIVRVVQGGTTLVAPKMYALLRALCPNTQSGKRDTNKLPAGFVDALYQAAMHGERLPAMFASRLVQGLRGDIVCGRRIDAARLALLKLYLIREGDSHMTHSLNPEHPHPAYQCGRLLAVLDRVQYRALGDVGAGVIDRFYGSASTRPAQAFALLMRLSNHHLKKLDTPEALFFRTLIGSIIDRLPDGFPKTLSLRDQGTFVCGFYHQRAFRAPSDETTITTDKE